MGSNSKTLSDIAFLTCRGGWPEATDSNMRKEIALDQAKDYYDMVVESDIYKVDGSIRNPQRVHLLMRSYARNQAAQAPLSHIRADMIASSNATLDEATIAKYLNALEQIFVIEDMPAWNPNLRSKTAIRTSATRYFVDPSIATAALGLGPDDLLNDLNTFGLLFETLCVRDLRVYADSLDGNVYHYRDSKGLECDAVIHLRNGAYGLIEIKLGGDRLIEEGCTNLIKLSAKIDTTRMNKPAFMAIVTAVGNYAYQRPDGICIIPIACLKN